MQQMAVILQTVDDAIVAFDAKQRILYVNPSWERLTGYASDEVLMRHEAFFLERDETPDSTIHMMQHSLDAGETWRGVLKGKRKDQSLYEIEVTVTPIKDEFDVIQRFVSVRRDVTEIRKVQEMKTRFVADLAHDVAAPIANLQLRLYLLKSNPQRAAEHATIMTRLVRQLDDMIKDLVTLIRLELGVLTTELERLDLNTIVMQVIEAQEPIAASKNLTMEFEATPNLPPVLVDAKQAERFISNLVANALNYTPSGGVVRVTTGVQGEQVVFTIRDTGIGIAPQALPHIFERFYRSEEAVRTAEGTGLGLAIVKEMVQRFGGSIEVESLVGKGTLFTIRLPAI
jgi:PAS domain S-box-containing protein